MTNTIKNIEHQIKLKGEELGFSTVGVTIPNSIPEAKSRLKSFLSNGYHGQMEWLEKRSLWRSNPKALWPEVKSVIVFTDSYTPNFDALGGLKKKCSGNISVYAHGSDYHEVMKKRLKKVGGWLVSKTGAKIKVFVDTAPVMEKPLAQAAGLGWLGKHSNLVSRKLGNWFFLGVIFTDLKINPDVPESDHCGACKKCIDVCPTAAFVGPYKLDATKCISYLTIEHKGPININFRKKLGNRIYGCDDCLAVCPWNKFAKKSNELKYFSKTELNLQSLEVLASLNDKEFRAMFAKSPVKRIGRDRFVRNVAYAMGNSKKTRFLPILDTLMKDADFSVRDAAQWAILNLKKIND